MKKQIVLFLLFGTLSLGSLMGGIAATATGSPMALKKMGPGTLVLKKMSPGTVVLKKMGPGTLTFLPQPRIIYPYQ